jgi:hypothetical protein
MVYVKRHDHTALSPDQRPDLPCDPLMCHPPPPGPQLMPLHATGAGRYAPSTGWPGTAPRRGQSLVRAPSARWRPTRSTHGPSARAAGAGRRTCPLLTSARRRGKVITQPRGRRSPWSAAGPPTTVPGIWCPCLQTKGPARTSVRDLRRRLLLYFAAVLAIRTFEFCF